MVSGNSLQRYLTRLEEARLYYGQGLKESAVEILQEILEAIRADELTEAEMEDLQTQIESEMEKMEVEPDQIAPGAEAEGEEETVDQVSPTQSFQYGKALMDGQFWEKAIQKFKQAAAIGFRTMECWELCGDCASHMEKWEEAIRYYEIVYTDPNAPEDLKRHIRSKITKRSQTQREIEVKSHLFSKSEAVKGKNGQLQERKAKSNTHDSVAPHIASLDESSIHQMIGTRLQSWCDNDGQYLVEHPYTYQILNLLHVGSSSFIFELEREETGERLAGQTLAAPFGSSLPAESLANWAHAQLMSDSLHIARIFDVAHSEDSVFIVREYLPLSLREVLSNEDPLPIPLAIFFAHRILEALGDLHLQMGRDKKIRNTFHLDLRPSRVVFHTEKPVVKIYNGGLWQELEKGNPKALAIQRLPLHFLPYRAPEQFRPYLARRKPPVFTDIYLFGVLFFEMLTGNPAFRASSFEEYEMQHCDQYPTAPKVWRPEIPEEINDMVMMCLDRDPLKRWRSTTQISLALEKAAGRTIQSMARNGSFAKIVSGLRTV